MAVETWWISFPSPSQIPGSLGGFAQQLEHEGFDGWAVSDSPAMAYDPYVTLATAGAATSRLRLSVGVTNPVLRHPITTASSAVTLHHLTGGRAVLGLGRGDSALAYVGMAPASYADFEHTLASVQTYLAGESVPFDEEAIERRGQRSVRTLGYFGVPDASRIEWAPGPAGKVPVDVAATGPRMIALAARSAERVSFGLGADVGRVRWAVESAAAAHRVAGVAHRLSLGVYLSCAVHPDLDTARRLCRGQLAALLRFASLDGSARGQMDEATAEVVTRLRTSYDMRRHAQAAPSHSGALDDEVVDRHGVVGTPERCVERLRALVDAGIGRIYVGTTAGLQDPDAALSRRLLIEEVLPAVRGLAPASLD